MSVTFFGNLVLLIGQLSCRYLLSYPALRRASRSALLLTQYRIIMNRRGPKLVMLLSVIGSSSPVLQCAWAFRCRSLLPRPRKPTRQRVTMGRRYISLPAKQAVQRVPGPACPAAHRTMPAIPAPPQQQSRKGLCRVRRSLGVAAALADTSTSRRLWSRRRRSRL